MSGVGIFLLGAPELVDFFVRKRERGIPVINLCFVSRLRVLTKL